MAHFTGKEKADLFHQKPWKSPWSSHSKHPKAAGLGPSLTTEIFRSKPKIHQVLMACFQVAHLPTGW